MRFCLSGGKIGKPIQGNHSLEAYPDSVSVGPVFFVFKAPKLKLSWMISLGFPLGTIQRPGLEQDEIGPQADHGGLHPHGPTAIPTW